MALLNYNVEPVIEGGIVTLLQGRGLAAHRAFSRNSLTAPYVTVKFQLGEEKQGDHLVSGGGVSYVYDAQVIFEVVTERDENGEQHDSMRSVIRDVMGETMAPEWEAAFAPTHRFLGGVHHIGTVPNVLDRETGIDVSSIVYSVTVEFLPQT